MKKERAQDKSNLTVNIDCLLIENNTIPKKSIYFINWYKIMNFKKRFFSKLNKLANNLALIYINIYTLT